MGKAKNITLVGSDDEPHQIELLKNPKPKKTKHKPRESRVVTGILEYLNSLPAPRHPGGVLWDRKYGTIMILIELILVF